MATVLMDGYETGITTLPNVTVTGGPAAVVGRDGVGVAFRSAAAAGTGTHTFTSGSDTIYLHIGRALDNNHWTASTGTNLFQIAADAGATLHLTAGMDASGHLTLKRGAHTGTLIATSTNTFASTWKWYSIQAKITLHDTTGECVIKVDGVEWINFTGDTKNAGTSTRPDTLQMGLSSSGSGLLADDLLINDTTGSVNNSYPGEVSIVGLRAAGNGAVSGLTGSDGNAVNNYQQVDEYPLTTTDYNGLVTAGAYDTYDMTANGKTGTVLAVQSIAYAVKTDAGAKSFKHVMRSATPTEVRSSAVALSTTYALYGGPIWTTNADGTAWTTTNLDTHEFGFEVV